jgi:hypothetical protein
VVDAQLAEALLDLDDDARAQVTTAVRSPASGRGLAALGRGGAATPMPVAASRAREIMAMVI